MTQEMLDELAALGVYVVSLDDPADMHRRLADILGEEHQGDYLEQKQNGEWTG